MMRAARSLLRREDGSAVVEMALTAPFLGLLLVGTVDMSRGYSSKLQLEQVAQRMIEKVQNGAYKEDDDYKAALKTEAAGAAGVDASAVTVSSWLECNNNSTKLDFTAECANEDDAFARYVEIDIQKTFVPLFPFRFSGANAQGRYTLHGTAGVRVQ